VIPQTISLAKNDSDTNCGGMRRSKRTPHLLQRKVPASLSCWHTEQITPIYSGRLSAVRFLSPVVFLIDNKILIDSPDYFNYSQVISCIGSPAMAKHGCPEIARF